MHPRVEAQLAGHSCPSAPNPCKPLVALDKAPWTSWSDLGIASPLGHCPLGGHLLCPRQSAWGSGGFTRFLTSALLSHHLLLHIFATRRLKKLFFWSFCGYFRLWYMVVFLNFGKHGLLVVDKGRREEGKEDGRKEKWHGRLAGAQTKLNVWRIFSTMKQSSLHMTFRCFSNTNTLSHNKTTINKGSQVISSLFNCKGSHNYLLSSLQKNTDIKNTLKRQHFHGINLVCSWIQSILYKTANWATQASTNCNRLLQKNCIFISMYICNYKGCEKTAK